MVVNLADHVKYLEPGILEISPWRCTVLYADTGKRKTTTAVRLIQNKGILVSADNSWVVLKKDIHKDLLDKWMLVEYEGVSQLDNLKPEGYDHIILDTVTAMTDRYIDLLLKEGKWTSGKTGYREVLSTNHPELKDVVTPAGIDYHVLRNRFRPTITKLVREYPCHIVLLMHAHFPSAMDKDKTIRPRMAPATFQPIAEMANIIGYITGGKGKSGFTVNMDESSPIYVGKCQLEGFSRTMDLEDFIQVYKETLV